MSTLLYSDVLLMPKATFLVYTVFMSSIVNMEAICEISGSHSGEHREIPRDEHEKEMRTICVPKAINKQCVKQCSCSGLMPLCSNQ
jgi:hypothetical protein